MSKDVTLEPITIPIYNAAAVTFYGIQLAFASSQHSYRAEQSGRWTELIVYHTETGRYALQVSGRSIREGEHSRTRVTFVDDLEELAKMLKNSALSQNILGQLNVVVRH